MPFFPFPGHFGFQITVARFHDAGISGTRSDPAMRQRVDHLLHRGVEEFYNLRRDPHCLANLLTGADSAPPAH